MYKKIVFILLTICCFTVAAYSADHRFTLVIDAGHGGHDAGAVGRVAKEKNLTLRYALAFGKMVEQNCPDVKVIYTRKTDRFVELYRRAEIANQNKADLFISIHINALPRGKVARGFQTYTLGTSKRTGKKNGVETNLEVAKRENSVILLEKDYKQTYHGYDPNSPESNIMFEFIQDKNMENSVELAKYMQRYVCQATGRIDMGAQQDNLAVLRLSSMPGCLVECGFISTRDEENFMNSSAAAELYAKGFFKAFQAYLRSHGGETKITYQPEVKKETAKPAAEKTRKKEARKKRKEREEVQQENKQEELNKKEEVSSQSELRKQEEEKKPEEAQGQKLTESKSEEQPVFKVQPQPVVQTTTQSQPAASADTTKTVVSQSQVPVFKVQVLASSSLLKSNNARFKGLKDISYYQEGGLYKYTVGSSENYNEILRLRREVAKTFPNAFIIAQKNGVRVDVNEAIREFKANKSRK